MAYVPKLEVPSIRTPPMPTSLPKPSIIPNNSSGMLPFLIPSLVAAGSSLIGSGISAISQSRANKANIQMMHEQNAYNEKMWHLNNAYNTPLMQRQRLEQAGINPALALSNISTGVAQGAVTSAPAPNLMPTIQGNPLAGAGSAFTSMYSTLKQNELLDAQVAKTQAEAKSIGQLTENTLNNGNVQREAWKAQIDSMNFNVDRLKSMLPYERDYLSAQIEATRQRMDVDKTVAQLNLSQLRLNSFQEKRLSAEISNIFASTALLVEQGRLTQEQAVLVSQQVITEKSKRLGIDIGNLFDAKTLGSRIKASNLFNNQVQTNINLMNREIQHFDIKEMSMLISSMASLVQSSNVMYR
uniref:DNA pilot protein n=1 Tax=Dulem virus 259 TaxID=3145736 RepID=A0AAU8B9Q7_9VIRU